jgi:hypothetical protein
MEDFHDRFELAVAILKAGKPLPFEPPRSPLPWCHTGVDCVVGTCIRGHCRQ